jgi:uncharacterized protein (TIGR02453 family)
MKYFTSDFLQFYKDLAANNNRDWFQANKKRYEASVKKPFELFVQEVIKQVANDDKRVNIAPSEAIFRINRDIRFSKDKTPYKLYSSAAISVNGRKSEADPGIYFELGPEKIGLAGGIYQPEKAVLEKIRSAIAQNPKALMKAVADKEFKKVWGDIQGEKNKIIPAEWRAAAVECPYLYNKQFYYWVELDSKKIEGDKLIDLVMKHYDASKPVKKFLEAAVK